MKRKIILKFILGLGLASGIAISTNSLFAKADDGKNVSRDLTYVHLENRWNDPYDETWHQQKWTKSSYELTFTSFKGHMNLIPFGHRNGVGPTGNFSIGDSRSVSKGGRYYFTNYLVEKYGTGNGAYIVDNTGGYGSGYGTWHADC